jgi:hypothetical protein
MCLLIAEASSAAATDEVTDGYMGHCGQWDGWHPGLHGLHIIGNTNIGPFR